jgi:isopentenyl phosphate kinase
MVLNDRNEICVLSGDTIAPTLANRLPRCERLCFISAHAVHLQDPRTHPNAPVISQLSDADRAAVDLNQDNHDVSGAMRGKVESIRQLCRKGNLTVTIAPPAAAFEAIAGSTPQPQFTTVVL